MEPFNPYRRDFLRQAGLLAGVAMVSPLSTNIGLSMPTKDLTIEITATDSNFEREPLIRPMGFKGGYLTHIWQTVAHVRSSNHTGLGLCSQSVLWSDAEVFARYSENGGNALMYAVTERALNMLKGEQFRSPVTIQEEMLDELYRYARAVTNNRNLRKTFVLNALVGVDNALWQLYARENRISSFDDMIPVEYRPALSYRHNKVVSVPTMAYALPVEEIKQTADQGFFFMKIKLGQPGTQKEMLEKDKERLTAIHNAIGHYRTEHSATGELPYYFDMNGRYEKKETLLRLLEHAKKIGAYDQIMVVEEPFPEHAGIDVHDIELRLAADESAHTDKDALKRIEMGYQAIALKAIAKTLSMTLKIAKVAHEHDIPCFCADLTVNPVLVEWNKNVAARLAPFPGLEAMGLMETNGHQNYLHWEKMRSYHPYPEATWSKTEDGFFNLNKDFYKKSGGILETPAHYPDLIMH